MGAGASSDGPRGRCEPSEAVKALLDRVGVGTAADLSNFAKAFAKAHQRKGGTFPSSSSSSSSAPLTREEFCALLGGGRARASTASPPRSRAKGHVLDLIFDASTSGQAAGGLSYGGFVGTATTLALATRRELLQLTFRSIDAAGTGGVTHDAVQGARVTPRAQGAARERRPERVPSVHDSRRRGSRCHGPTHDGGAPLPPPLPRHLGPGEHRASGHTG